MIPQGGLAGGGGAAEIEHERALLMCKEIVSAEIPEIDAFGRLKKKPKKNSDVDEFMRRGKQLKKLGDDKFQRDELARAQVDYVYAGLRFYQAAMLMEHDQVGSGKALLAQTGSFSLGCITKPGCPMVSRGLHFFLASCCYGFSFSSCAKDTRRDHKKSLLLSREKPQEAVAMGRWRAMLECCNDAYKAVELLQQARESAPLIPFPHGVFACTADEMTQFLETHNKLP